MSRWSRSSSSGWWRRPRKGGASRSGRRPVPEIRSHTPPALWPPTVSLSPERRPGRAGAAPGGRPTAGAGHPYASIVASMACRPTRYGAPHGAAPPGRHMSTGPPVAPDPAPVPPDVVCAVPSGEIAYGLELPVVSRPTPHAAAWESEAGPAQLARLARVADESGFFSLAVGDRTAVPRRLAAAMGTVWFDATATLGWLAAVTRHVHLLPHLYVLAQRHPLPRRQGALHDRRPLGRAPHRRGGRGVPPRGVRAVRGGLRQPRPAHR